MGHVKVYLLIEKSDHFGSGELFEWSMETPFCPAKGDRIELFPDGAMGVVHEVYWSVDGSVRIDLEHYILDPNESMQKRIMDSVFLSRHLNGWYSDQDGDLSALLLGNGWNLYSSPAAV